LRTAALNRSNLNLISNRVLPRFIAVR
jgi:hypothetical protein